MYSNSIVNNGSIQANGKENNKYSYGAPGGSTGGGTINIFYSNSIYQGNVTANGGAITWNYDDNFTVGGGAGGNGCITFSKINMP